MESREEFKVQLKEMIIRVLKLEMEPGEIDDGAALFGEGLGLDSIDALELVVGLEKEFGVAIADQEVGRQAFASIDALADYVLSQKG